MIPQEILHPTQMTSAQLEKAMLPFLQNRLRLTQWALYIIGPLSPTNEGHNYILVMLEPVTRWVCLKV